MKVMFVTLDGTSAYETCIFVFVCIVKTKFTDFPAKVFEEGTDASLAGCFSAARTCERKE